MIEEIYQELVDIIAGGEGGLFVVIPYIIDVLFGVMGILVFVSLLDSIFSFMRSGGDGNAMEEAAKGIRLNIFTFLSLYLFWIVLRLVYSYTIYMLEELVI